MAPESRIDELTARYAENPRRYFAPLANEYRKLGDPERAIALCRVHLPSQPGHMSGHIVLGQALFDAGELAAARAAFATAVALDDENLVALRRLGDISRLEGDHAEARTWYARVLDADPQQPEVEALMATLAAEAAEREARAQDSAAVAADAESRPLPAPTGTPFPGGIGFSEEELDAFIAHVPVAPDEAEEAGGPVRASEVAGSDGAAPAAPLPALGAAPLPEAEAASPADTVEVTEPVPADEESVAWVEFEAEVAAESPARPPALPADEPAPEVLHVDRAPAEPVAEVPRVAGDEPSVQVEAGAAEAGAEAPHADVVEDAPAPGEPAEVAVAVEAEPLRPVDDPAWASARPIESSWTVPGVEAAETGPAAQVPNEEPWEAAEPELAPLAEREPLAGTFVDGEDGEGAMALPIVDIASLAPDDVDAVPASTVDTGAAEAGAAEAGAAEAGVAEGAVAEVAVAEDAEAMPTVEAPGAPPNEVPFATRAVTPVRAAALRLLSSLAPWREGATPAAGSASVAAPSDAVGATPAAGGRIAEQAAVVAEAPEMAGTPEAIAIPDLPAAEGSAAPVPEAPDVPEVPGAAATSPAIGSPEMLSPEMVSPAPASPAPASPGSMAPVMDASMDASAEAGGTGAAGHRGPVADGEPRGAHDEPEAAARTGDGMGAGALVDAAAAWAGDDAADESAPLPSAGARRPTPASFTTATMAELYRRQGFIAEALAVYRELAEREPGDAWYRAQVVALAQELAQRTPQVPSQVVDSNINDVNDLDVGTSGAAEGAGGSLTPPGFASIAPALAESAALAPEPAGGEGAHGDWFGDVHEPAADDWFGDVVPAEAAAVDELFGMEPADEPARPAVPTPISLDALGSGLDELFGVPVIASTDAAAAAWLESLAGELVGRAAGRPESLPVPEAFDVPRGGTASAPGPLLSFDRFFGPTPPSVRRVEEGGAPQLPPVSIGPSFGGTPLVTPRSPEPAPWERAATPPPPPVPPAAGEVKPPPSEFHRWLEGLT